MSFAAPDVEQLGRVPGRGDVQAQRWRLALGDVAVAVGTFGARLLEVHVPDVDGTPVDVVAGPKGAAGHEADGAWPYAGATVGRFANRLGGARVVLDGDVHRLDPNEAGTTLHGGTDGFHVRHWAARDASDAQGPGVALSIVSRDGDQGFPGTLRASVTHRLRPGGRLEVTYRATSDAPTVVNLTNHAYWDLSGAVGTSPGAVGGHTLRVRASRYVVVDRGLLPTGVAAVDGTRHDLREPTRLEHVLARGDVDHCMLLDPGGPAAVLAHPGSGRRMVVTTDQPGLQVYLGRELVPAHAALALEPEVAPDAPNRHDLPLGPTRGVLRPGRTYVHTTTHDFSVGPGVGAPGA